MREAAQKDSKLRFTALLHHINFDCLYAAFFNLKKTAAVGVDEMTWHEYEQDFVGFSYGFRPGRSQHNALDALTLAITGKKVNWILDADIEGLSIPPERWSCRRTCFRQSSGSSHPPLPAALTRLSSGDLSPVKDEPFTDPYVRFCERAESRFCYSDSPYSIYPAPLFLS